METVHATTVAIDGKGVLLRGPSGSGKSDLALLLIDDGAVLVSVDRTQLALESGHVVADAPSPIVGRIEVRGVGIVRRPSVGAAPLGLVVDLVRADAVERMPAPASIDLLGVAIPRIRLAPFEASAAAKVRLAVGLGPDDIER